MNKNNVFTSERLSDRKDKHVHPVWRGIGFVMMIFIPILSYLASSVILEANSTEHWFPIPKEFVIRWQTEPYILMKLFITAILCFIIYALFNLITFFMMALFGPKRYIGPDMPPLKKPKRRLR
jgi:hypothetical protein